MHRAVNNARRRGTQAPPYGQPGGAYGGGAAAGQLDQNALSALQELPQEQATSILDELASKGAGVRNPSAYVVKAVGNARRNAEHLGGVPPGGFRDNGPPPDYRGGGGSYGGGGGGYGAPPPPHQNYGDRFGGRGGGYDRPPRPPKRSP